MATGYRKGPYRKGPCRTAPSPLREGIGIIALAFLPVSFMAEALLAEPLPAAEDGTGGSVETLIEAIRSAAPAAELPPLADRLARAGDEAIDATRRARDSLPEGPARTALAAAARWQLARRVSPRLLDGFESQLTYAGQYLELIDEGPEILDALLALLDDEATDPRVRLSACRALADAIDPGLDRPAPIVSALTPERRQALVSRLRGIYHDILFPPGLREQVGILLAILGDMQAVESSIRRLLRLAESRDQIESADSHVRLANVYYRIRDYEKAVRSYDRVLEFYEKVIAFQRRQDPEAEFLARLERELALEYYNAACSNALARDVTRAQELLRRAVVIDSMHLGNLENDGDLTNVRKAPDYESFRRELEAIAGR